MNAEEKKEVISEANKIYDVNEYLSFNLFGN